jgi:hypothetical protein
MKFIETSNTSRLLVEDEWLESAHDRALSIDGGPMWFNNMIEWLA